MRDHHTLQITNQDQVGHWVLLLCDLTTTTAYLFDSLGKNNEQVSETAVFNFSKDIFEAISFYRTLPLYRQIEVSLNHIPIQSTF